MSTDVSAEPMGPVVEPARRTRREVIYRHTLPVRVTHWVNAVVIFLMIGTGLNIFNAHPRLYWGQKGDAYDLAVLSIHPASVQGATRGITQLGSWRIDTTGVLGWSQSHGSWMARAWPGWITIPSFQDLADSRHWHFFLAWTLIANGAVYLAWSLWIRHVQRDLWPTWRDLKSIPRSIWEHLRNKHPTGEEAKRYNVLQKLAYLGLISLVLGMVGTGLTLSPGLDAFAPWLLDVFGGRQSARTLHFAFAAAIALFIFVHVAEVFLAGPINEIRSIITGAYHVPPDRPPTPRLHGGRG
ncbi:cytochrome b/b6 domain-containing protein [Caulobacter sp. S45]|uniref:cytochrome b/b6 domain-containing protein n=1 Tax=Caulobacter sp. S45 TaxID=1641861 RepID=UPI0020C63790|nr:cytochrome b/b6 domain-containing protein [Caulobacter sp. S45]